MPFTMEMFSAPQEDIRRGPGTRRRTPSVVTLQPNTQLAAATTMADYREPIAADKVFCTAPDIASNF